ncbi:MAG: hypothetical protein ACRELC_03160 [Gemmatimonadota bacterium]
MKRDYGDTDLLGRDYDTFAKGAAQELRRKLREQAGRKVHDKIDELKGKPALFLKWADENPELVREYSDAHRGPDDDEADELDKAFTKSMRRTALSADAVADNVERMAKNIRAQDPKLSHAQAVRKALEIAPGLYDEYRYAKEA